MINEKMLRYILDSMSKYGSGIDTDEFFKQYPNNASTKKDLLFLHNTGYITLMNAEDNYAYALAVNEKALNYFK